MEFAIDIDEADSGGRDEAILKIGVGRINGREEFGKDCQDNQREHHQSAGDGRAALSEPLPYELEVGLVLLFVRPNVFQICSNRHVSKLSTPGQQFEVRPVNNCRVNLAGRAGL